MYQWPDSLPKYITVGEFISLRRGVRWLLVNVSESYSWVPSHKCHTNIGPILSGYRTTDILISRRFEPYVEHHGHSFVLNDRKQDCKFSLCVPPPPINFLTKWLIVWNSVGGSCQWRWPQRRNFSAVAVTIPKWHQTCTSQCGTIEFCMLTDLQRMNNF
jgi:hypothetical protein